MAIIDELRILVTAEVTKAIADLNKTEQATNKAGAGFKDFAKQIAGYTTGMGLAVDATKKVLSTIGQLAKESVVLAAGFETSRTSWGVLLGDVEKGEQMFDRIFALAAKTPLSFQDVEQGARTLGQYGIESEKIIPAIKMLGDISMGNGEKLRSLSIAYGQVMSTGRLMGQDLLQLINNGFNPLKVISQKTGESMADLKKRMSDGGVSAQEVADAFKSATSEGGLFYNMMDKTAETTAGKWSTAQDNFKQSLAELGEKIIPIVNKALDEYNKTASRMQSKRGVEKVLAGESKSYESITDAIREVNLELDELESKIPYDTTGELEVQKQLLLDQKTTLTAMGQEAYTRATNAEKLRVAEKDRLATLDKEAAARKAGNEGYILAQRLLDENYDKRQEILAQIKQLNALQYQTPEKETARIAALKKLKEQLEALDVKEQAHVDIMIDSAAVAREAADAEASLYGYREQASRELVDMEADIYASADAMEESKEKVEEETELIKNLKNVAVDAFGSIGSALGEALVNGEEGWEAFADAGKSAIASVLEAFAKQWAIEAIAAYANPATIPQAVGYTAASIAGYAGAGAIRAMANGGEFDTTGPTMMMVGEAGREHVSVSPASRGGGGGATVINYNIAGSLVSGRQLNQRIRSASTGSNR